MKKQIKNSFIILAVLTVFITTTGCNNSNDDLNMKIIQELEYLDTSITSILMELNEIEFNNYTIETEEIQMSKKNEEKTNTTVTELKMQPVLDTDNNKIDWVRIKNEIEKINETWSIVLLDLTSTNVERSDILEFSRAINNALLSIKNENKLESIKNVAEIYSFIPKFENQTIQNDGNKNTKQVKAYLFNAYSYVEESNWQEIERYISNAEEEFKNIINDLDYIKNKEFKINKTYILIKELQNSLVYKDKQVFYVKFKNLMESINML